MKKISAGLLAIAMFAAVLLTACKPSSNPGNQTSAATSNNNPSSTNVLDSFENTSEYNGKEYVIYGSAEQLGGTTGIVASEDRSDTTDDALWRANQQIEAKYGVKLKEVLHPGQMDDSRQIELQYNNGECRYDVTFGHDVTFGSMALRGIFLDVNSLPYVDTSKQWWPQQTVDSMSVDGHMFLFANYMTYYHLSNARCYLINKDLADDYNVTLPYQKVKDMEWTLDAFRSTVKDLRVDDGDGHDNGSDIFGYGWDVATFPYDVLQCAFGISTYEKDPDTGLLVANPHRDKLTEAASKLYQILYVDRGAQPNGADAFLAGRSLYQDTILRSVTGDDYRNADFSWGVLPLPMLNETQQKYISAYTTKPYGIMSTHKNPEFVGLLTEALTAVGYSIVYPAYYVQSVTINATTDMDSRDMVEIIGDTLYLDNAYIYSGYKGYCKTLGYTVGKKKSEVISYIDSVKSQEEARVETINNAFQEYAS